MPPDTIRVAVVDDHPIFRAGVRALVNAQPDMCVVGEADDTPRALSMLSESQPDVLLLDVNMPGTNGLEFLPEALRVAPDTRVLILTAGIEPAQVARAVSSGAHGVLLKHLATDLLPKALRQVMAGEYWIGREGVAQLASALRGQHPIVPQRHSPLTAREIEIVRGVARAESNKQIAAALGISEQTVKNRLRIIYEKLGVTNRVELALKAGELFEWL
jgi:two-component system nitrate/nitrite response regulator NarL